MTTKAPKKRTRAGVPEMVEMPDRKMAVVRSKGDPGVVSEYVFPALYGAVYKLKFARKKAGESVFTVGPLVGHWPDAPGAEGPVECHLGAGHPGRRY